MNLDDDEIDVANAWIVEIARRMGEVNDATAQLEEWSVVRDRLAARAAEKRAGVLASDKEQ